MTFDDIKDDPVAEELLRLALKAEQLRKDIEDWMSAEARALRLVSAGQHSKYAEYQATWNAFCQLLSATARKEG